MPGQALRVPGGWGSQILRHSAHEVGKVVSLTHRLPSPPGNIPGTHFCVSHGHSAAGKIMSMKNSNDIETTTFQLVARCLNQLRHRVRPVLCTVTRKQKAGF